MGGGVFAVFREKSISQHINIYILGVSNGVTKL